MSMSGLAEPPSGRLKVKVPDETLIPVETSNDYRLAANDVVHIKVFQEDELETTERIAKNGTVTIPLIKNATIGGLTRREAEQRIEALFKEYLVKPQVTVRIVEYTKRRITVLGQVNDPGAIELPAEGSIDVLEAIGMAGGYSRIANPSKITVKRKVGGKDTIIKLDGKKMANDAGSSRFEVMPGDTISVGERLF
jgi:polysaccharide export outer membrane protein